MTDHLRPTAAIHAAALLPSDPGLALELAQRLLVKPLMANHHHGLWGYSGITAEGLELTIQSTGLGAASAVAVAEELAQHGVQRAVRVGRCRALVTDLAAGDPLVATAAPGAGASAGPDEGLLSALEALVGADTRLAPVAPASLLADLDDPQRQREWSDAGAVAADLETAALLGWGFGAGVAIAAALAVGRDHGGRRDEPRVAETLTRLADCAARALARPPSALAQEPAPGAVNLP